jgi:hypothetical protein
VMRMRRVSSCIFGKTWSFTEASKFIEVPPG